MPNENNRTRLIVARIHKSRKHSGLNYVDMSDMYCTAPLFMFPNDATQCKKRVWNIDCAFFKYIGSMRTESETSGRFNQLASPRLKMWAHKYIDKSHDLQHRNYCTHLYVQIGQQQSYTSTNKTCLANSRNLDKRRKGYYIDWCTRCWFPFHATLEQIQLLGDTDSPQNAQIGRT